MPEHATAAFSFWRVPTEAAASSCHVFFVKIDRLKEACLISQRRIRCQFIMTDSKSAPIRTSVACPI
jgi:hypothetical protein